MIVAALQRNGRIGDYRIEAIDGLPRAQVIEKLGQSRFFLSLLHRESIGFPVAEAMAAGTIAIGYTGLGAREYFTPETGFPVEEGDMPAIVETFERAVARHARDPAAFERLRRHACDTVHARYGRTVFETGALEAWRQLDRSLPHPPRADPHPQMGTQFA